ncbi:pyridoxal phosphate-dependent decarboxylase family protein [Rhizomonospora bruguierae]|uniref:pyridoxal phosphate-dependent decarboxylase family protein n=1 Tax=Rhizomonospora bruguierae TaxID=1581705 RepID=UPI001BCF2F53|nr:pyridoxal-dependent decarboxylase [Micromonospora sp. NBRC 107566]
MSSDDTGAGALLGDRHPDEIAALVGKAAKIGIDFFTGQARNDLVLRYAPQRELLERFAEPLPQTPISDDALLDSLAEVARWSVAQHDQRYLAFPDVGSSVAGVAAGVVATFLNQNLIAYDRSAPAGSAVEAQLLLWLRELVGFSSFPLDEYVGLRHLGGMWTSGGNMSNHIAMTVALAATWPDVRRDGLRCLPERPVVVLARGVEHFSYLSAAQVLGLGSSGLVWSTANSDHTSDVGAIAAALENPPEGTRPFMVVGVAGNCRTTGIDRLAEIADLCAKHGVWFHVDACHGGSLLFSDHLRGELAGIERADSVSLDPHKGLFITYPSSYMLVQDPEHLARFSRYPDKLDDPACLDLGLITPFYGSRGFESLRLWAMIKHLGRTGIARLVEQREETFREMHDLIESTGYFQMIGAAGFYRCAFVYCPPEARRLVEALREHPELVPRVRAVVSHYTQRFAQTLYVSGRVVFDLFAVQDLGDALGLGTEAKIEVLGMCVGHPTMEAGVKEDIVKHISAVGDDLVDPLVGELRALGVDEAQEAWTAAVHGPAGW